MDMIELRCSVTPKALGYGFGSVLVMEDTFSCMEMLIFGATPLKHQHLRLTGYIAKTLKP